MNDRLLVGTRKGLFELRRSRGDWSIAGTRFLGDPISMLLADPRDGTLYAAEALGHFGVKLQRSRDHGATWQEIPAPAFPKTDADGPERVVSVLPGARWQPISRGWIWCGTIPGALFLSKDHGETWSIEPGTVEPAGAQGLDGRRVRRRRCRLDLHRSARRGTCHCRCFHRRRLDRREDGGAHPGMRSSDGMYADYFPPPRRSCAGGAGHPSPGAMSGRTGHDVGAAP